MKGDFTGVLAPYVTKIEKIGSETRADDIRTMSTIGKKQESLPINSDEMNKMTFPKYMTRAKIRAIQYASMHIEWPEF